MKGMRSGRQATAATVHRIVRQMGRPPSQYQSWKQRCEQLELELAEARAQIPKDKCRETFVWLMDTAEHLLGAARCLIEMRRDKDEPKPADELTDNVETPEV